jgi:Flp pilus assembly protein TadD
MDQAEHHYREALRSKSDVHNALNNLGVIHYRRGDYRQAEDYYMQALAVNPHAAQTLNNLALILWDRGDVTGAIQKVRESLSLKPVYPAAERNLARFLALSGDTKGAETVLAQLTGEDPRSGSVAALLGEIFQEAGDADRAVLFYREAGEKAVDDPALLNRAGYGLHQLGVAGDAETYYRRAILLDPQNRLPVLNMGNLLFETGNTQAAIAFLEEKSALFPEAPEIFHNLGVYWEREGDLSRAVEYLKTALRVEPGYPPSLDRLTKLRGRDMK